MFEDFNQKKAVVLVYTGEGKGKTSAALGLTGRALGAGMRVAFLQFIKYWDVSEHKFLERVVELYGNQFTFYKGGAGFYNAGEMSAKGVKDEEHKSYAQKTYTFALEWSESGEYDLIVCDEIFYALQEALVTKKQIELLIRNKYNETSLCLTGRGFPPELIDMVDIVTEMRKVKHHFDDKYLANKGIDY